MESGPINWQAAQVSASHLDAYLLGCVDFDAYLCLQDRLAVEIQSRTDRRGILLACEHPPTFTLGRDGGSADLPQDPDDLEAQRIPWRWVSRGGGTWRHGPGQLSLSIIAPLDRLGISPTAFRAAATRAVLAMSREQMIPAKAAIEMPGVTGRVGQFAFFGAAIRGGVSQFGLIVNVAPSFSVVTHTPQGVRSSSLSAERMKPIAMAAVRESLIRHLADNLNYDDCRVQTGHPWLRRTRQLVPIHA